jgi:hypothetical protein
MFKTEQIERLVLRKSLKMLFLSRGALLSRQTYFLYFLARMRIIAATRVISVDLSRLAVDQW